MLLQKICIPAVWLLAVPAIIRAGRDARMYQENADQISHVKI